MKKIFCLLLFISFAAAAQPPTYTATVNNPPAGYYFVSAYKSASISFPTILDESGSIVYYERKTGSNSLDFRVWPNGQVSYHPSSINKFLLMDSAFYPVDTVAAAGYSTDIHEMQILPNGHYLLLAFENVTQDLSAYNYFNHNGSPGSTTATVTCNIIQELDANKNLVFDWHLKDHLSFDEADPFFLNSPNNVDWSHSNALELDQDGNILLSSRHFNEITKIDRTTGNVLWHFGGNYNQFTFLTDTVPFYGQHDVRRLPNGHITLYDDGHHAAGSSHAARALEYELDEINMTAKLVWSYTYDSLMYSVSQGGLQVLPNKNALIDFGNTNKDSVCFVMADSLGTELYELKFAGGLYSYRVHYYPNLPWQLPRPTISCYDSLGTFYLKADSAYSAYLWSDGSTNSSIAITNTGTYYVFVPYGPNGHVSSYPLAITDLNAQCGGTTFIAAMDADDHKLFPNPALNQITVVVPAGGPMPAISDVYGNSIELRSAVNANGSYAFDISGLAGGVYFVKTKYKTLKFIKGGE